LLFSYLFHCKAGIIVMYHYGWPVYWDEVSNILSSLASKYDPPNPCFLSCWDYRCVSLHPVNFLLNFIKNW
jgi:hypothetical protein